MWMNVLVSGTVLVLAVIAFFSYDLISFRQNLIRNLGTSAQIVSSVYFFFFVTIRRARRRRWRRCVILRMWWNATLLGGDKATHVCGIPAEREPGRGRSIASGDD